MVDSSKRIVMIDGNDAMVISFLIFTTIPGGENFDQSALNIYTGIVENKIFFYQSSNPNELPESVKENSKCVILFRYGRSKTFIDFSTGKSYQLKKEDKKERAIKETEIVKVHDGRRIRENLTMEIVAGQQRKSQRKPNEQNSRQRGKANSKMNKKPQPQRKKCSDRSEQLKSFPVLRH